MRASRSRSDSTRCTCSRSSSTRSEEHTSELQSRLHLVCRLLLEKKKKKKNSNAHWMTTRVHEQNNNSKLLHAIERRPGVSQIAVCERAGRHHSTAALRACLLAND